MAISRRKFIHYSTLATGAGLFSRNTLAQQPTVSLGNKTLLVIFLRGGADGLQLVPPTGAIVPQQQIDAYKQLRPTKLSASAPDEIGYVPYNERSATSETFVAPLSLDGYFELHPHLPTLKNLFSSQQMAVVHAVGQSGSRSHFDSQDALEFGGPIVNGVHTATPTGWLHDAINVQLNGAIWADSNQKVAAAVGFGSGLPTSMFGSAQADKIVSMTSMDAFGFDYQTSSNNDKLTAIRALFSATGSFSNLKHSASVAMDIKQKILNVPRGTKNRIFFAASNNSMNVDISPYHAFANQLEDVADMVKSGMAPAFVNINLSTWDTHGNQYNRVDDIAAALNTVGYFYQDIGSYSSQVCTLVMTEFGRTLDVNEEHGTDHGDGGAMFVIGGGVNGGRVYGQWPGLPVFNNASKQWESTSMFPNATSTVSGRPLLKATTSFQNVYYELLANFVQLPANEIATILNNYQPGTQLGLFG